MIHLGYFEGRVIIGRLTADKYGFEARELHKSLQKIALTYHLPGPALLPITSEYKNSKESDADTKSHIFNLTKHGSPSIIIYGNSEDLFLRLPKIKKTGLVDCSDLNSELSIPFCKEGESDSEINFLPIKYSKGLFLAIPSMPQQLTISREPKYAISHYIEWLSAYYSPLINNTEEVRRDVLFEASTVNGLPYGKIERTFSKILLSYEQLTSPDFSHSSYQIETSNKRLKSQLRFVKNFKDPELYGLVLNLLAITEVYRADYQGKDYAEAKTQLKAIINSKKVSDRQKNIASYNLGMILNDQ